VSDTIIQISIRYEGTEFRYNKYKDTDFRYNQAEHVVQIRPRIGPDLIIPVAVLKTVIQEVERINKLPTHGK